MRIPKTVQLKKVIRCRWNTIRIYFDPETKIWYRRDNYHDGEQRDNKTTKKYMVDAWLGFKEEPGSPTYGLAIGETLCLQ